MTREPVSKMQIADKISTLLVGISSFVTKVRTE